jgi:hypothetical protein
MRELPKKKKNHMCGKMVSPSPYLIHIPKEE